MEGGDLFGEDQAVLDASLQPDVCASLCSAPVQTLVALSSPLILFFFLSLLQLQHALLQNRIISAREIKCFSCYEAGSFPETFKFWLAA